MLQPNIMLEGEQQQRPHNLPQEMNNTTPQSQMRKAAKGKEPKSKPRKKNQSRTSSSRNDHDQNQPAGKKPYHRHSQYQIFEMESFFKECPHPHDKQRRDLGQKLGLSPLQIKFWFQNKRTQMKNHHERHESTHLKTEIEYLHMEINRYKEALSSAMCLTCNGPLTIREISYNEQQLKLENARLREEINRISEIASKYVGKHMLPQYSVAPLVPSRASLDLPTGSFGMYVGMGAEMYEAAEILRSMPGLPDAEKQTIVEFAVVAMDELIRLVMLGQPVWTPAYDGSTEILSLDEYVRIFPRGISPKRFGLSSEGTRETAVVAMNHINLVEILMDVNQWAHMFSTIVSKAVTLEVLTAGVGAKYNGALQVITAEFQVPTPLVPARESYFARYCKQHGDGIWAVVDVSLDILRPCGLDRCQRKPSGCVIQEMPNGHSKVTWIEHMEVDDKDTHQMYKTIVRFGLLFGAKRWLATLDRQCQRLAIVMAGGNPGGDGAITSQEERNNILKLGERMVNSFCAGVCASTTHSWTPVSGNGFDDVRVMMKRISDDPGRPSGIVLSASTSFWLPHPNKRVFDYLRSENSRNEWDILASEGAIEEIANIENGREPGNCISLLRVKCLDSNHTNMLLLQECCTDPTGSLVIYAPTDIASMNMVLSGGDPDYVALLPSGFSLFPDGAGGSILTLTIQILIDSASTENLSISSITTIDNLISCTIEKMKVLIKGNA
ncbi:hypothetical protein AAC387_Pa03g0268 [Persea americana]